MTNRLPGTLALIAGALVSAAAAPASAETAKQILDAAMDRYEKRVEHIESLTVIQEIMGMEQTARFRKETVDGRPVLVPGDPGMAGDPGTLYGQVDALAEEAQLKGTEDVDGHACWVIHVPQMENMTLAPEASEDFEAEDGTFYFDKKDLVVRRMQVNGTARNDGEETPVTMELRMTDYRDVDGWLHPYRTEMSLGGVGGAEMPEAAEMREAMAQMKEEMAKMPPEQRKMMEEMMKNQMPQLEKMAESGRLSVTVTVKEIRVNEGAE